MVGRGFMALCAILSLAGPALDPRCTTGRAMCVDKTSRSLRWVVDGVVRKSVEVRFGSDELPTREGAFAVFRKSRDHVSSLYDTPMPFAMFFSGGQAVHYSPDFAANGYYGAWALSTNAPELPLAAATARVSATKAMYECARENIQIHGGMGFTWEFDCHMFYRRAKLLSLVIGSQNRWEEKLIQALTAGQAA